MYQRPFEDRGGGGGGRGGRNSRYGRDRDFYNRNDGYEPDREVVDSKRFWDCFHCENCLSKGHAKSRCNEKEKFVAIRESELNKMIERLKAYEEKEKKEIERLLELAAEIKKLEKKKRKEEKEKRYDEIEKMREREVRGREKEREKKTFLKEKARDAKLSLFLEKIDGKKVDAKKEKVKVGTVEKDKLTEQEGRIIEVTLRESRRVFEEVLLEREKSWTRDENNRGKSKENRGKSRENKGGNTEDIAEKEDDTEAEETEASEDIDKETVDKKKKKVIVVEDNSEDVEKSAEKSVEDAKTFLDRIVTEAKKLNGRKGTKKTKSMKLSKLINEEDETKIKEMLLLATKMFEDDMEEVDDVVGALIT